jgi:ribosomal 30S subunit maturation factor RimM
MTVVNEAGEALGIVKAVRNFGAEDLLEISPRSGNNFYLPYRSDFIIESNTDTKQIIITDYEDYIG